MPLAACSSPSDPATEPARECDEATQPCPHAERLTNLTVVEGARQDGVEGQDRWATVKRSTEAVVIEATTEPNTRQVWARLRWSGDVGEAVSGHLNRRRLSRSNSTVLRPAVSLAGTTESVEIWVVAATIEIRSRGRVPPNAAPFHSGDVSGQIEPGLGPDLGPITYESLTGNIYPGDRYVLNMGARGKIVAVATLTPSGVHNVVTSGWNLRRERWTRQWANGRPGEQTTTSWDDDTSNRELLRLTPDANDRIYDTDGPNIRWGTSSYEIYHNFRQWVEWHSERCSDYGYWHFRARWRAHPNQSQQIVLNEVGPGQRPLPENPALR
jgi:hypothetical protein